MFIIGANDVANAFGTSVGAKAISMKAALVVAGIFEFLGSFLMGSHVTGTIQKGISDPVMFVDEPETLMFGMCCVLIGVSAWLIIATLYSLPVSTTHSCIGGLVGMALVAKGWHAVQWIPVLRVVASWFISPVLSGCITSLIFWIVRKYVLRTSNSFENAFRFYPLIIGFTLFVLSYFMLSQGLPNLPLHLSWYMKIVISILIGVVLAVILKFTAVPYLRRKIEREMKQEEEMKQANVTIAVEAPKAEQADVEVFVEVPKNQEMASVEGAAEKSVLTTEKPVETVEKPVEKSTETVEKSTETVEKPVEKPVETKEVPIHEKNTMTHQNIHAELTDEKSVVYQIHQRAEKFDPHTERIFSYLQVLTATLNSFAHGANDVANSIGPLASIIAIYKSGSVPLEGSTVDTWILAMGGAGIVVGLACLGYKVMAAIGVNMVTVTPSRGFAIEIGSAFVIVTGSQMGLPLSTTHCQVGSTVGIGLVEGKSSVNWKLVGQVIVGWAITLLVCGITAGAIFAFAIFSPSRFH